MSGGLDSSIVLAAMAKAGRSPDCLTIATQDPSGDERGHARTMAQSLHLPLHERTFDVEQVDPLRCVAPHLPRPKRRMLYQSFAAISAEIAKKTKADAYINGNGGDQIFFFTRSATAIVDCLAARRTLLQTFATFENICSLTDSSFLDVAKATWRRFRQGRAYRWTPNTTYLQGVGGILPSHPWLHPPRGVLAGKAVHAAMLLQMQDSIENFMTADGPPMVTPLFAQPVMEACLAIPTWEWVQGGIDRSVARKAFGDLLPQSVLARRHKQGPTSFNATILETYRAEIRDMLLHGLLADNGVLDVRAVTDAFSQPFLLGGSQVRALLDLVDAEAWCRHWSRRS